MHTATAALGAPRVLQCSAVHCSFCYGSFSDLSWGRQCLQHQAEWWHRCLQNQAMWWRRCLQSQAMWRRRCPQNQAGWWHPEKRGRHSRRRRCGCCTHRGHRSRCLRGCCRSWGTSPRSCSWGASQLWCVRAQVYRAGHRQDRATANSSRKGLSQVQNATRGEFSVGPDFFGIEE